MTNFYTAVLSPNVKVGKVFASVPDIPGCVTSGKDLSDAIEQITDALSACLVTYEDEHIPIPAPSPQKTISTEIGDICTLVKVDTLAYRAKTDTRCVRKNVSVPMWMVSLADSRGINCSRVLQDALREKLQA